MIILLLLILNRSNHSMDPVEHIGASTLLDVQQFLPDFEGDLSNSQLLIHRNRIINSFVMNFLDSTHNHSCSCTEHLQKLTFFMSFYHFSNKDLPLWHFVLAFMTKQLLHKPFITTIESLVIPGRIRSSSRGVATSIWPDLSLKTKKILDDPTSIIF